MGERKHKSEGGEKKDKSDQNKKAIVNAAHPILQLQQTIGNKYECPLQNKRKVTTIQTQNNRH